MAEPITAGDSRRTKVTLARALTEPTFLDAFNGETASAIDTHRLGLLAGFVSKVRNNDIWEILPASRAFIRAAECEIAVFAQFRFRQTRERTPLLERAAAFVELLSDPSASLPAACRPAGDLARHEYLLAALPRALSDREVAEATNHARPCLASTAAIQAYRWDPIALADPDASLIPGTGQCVPETEDTFLCYTVDRTGGDVHVLRLDPAVALILSLADGTRRRGDIAHTAGAGIDQEIVDEVLATASRAGLLEGERSESSNADAVLNVVRGHATGRLLYTLERCGALARLTRPCAVSDLGDELDLDHQWLGGVLAYLATDGNLIRELPGHRYVLELDDEASAQLVFELRKFIGGYGRCLDRAAPAPRLVDDDAIAGAFSHIGQARRAREPEPTLPQVLLTQHDVDAGVLDLGCGAGDLLLDLATAKDEFHGIGLDANPAMIEAARSNAAAAGVAPRITFLSGDARVSVQSLTTSMIGSLRSVYAGSFFNALFGSDTADAIGMLRILRSQLPERLLLIDDYYGELGQGPRIPGRRPLGELQDLVQVASGQGVPPMSRAAWFALYETAGCEVVAVYEGEHLGVRRFLHLLRLTPAPA